MATRGKTGDGELKKAVKTGQKTGGLSGSLGRTSPIPAGQNRSKSSKPPVKPVVRMDVGYKKRGR